MVMQRQHFASHLQMRQTGNTGAVLPLVGHLLLMVSVLTRALGFGTYKWSFLGWVSMEIWQSVFFIFFGWVSWVFNIAKIMIIWFIKLALQKRKGKKKKRKKKRRRDLWNWVIVLSVWADYSCFSLCACWCFWLVFCNTILVCGRGKFKQLIFVVMYVWPSFYSVFIYIYIYIYFHWQK
jgi:hypothetical protein